MTNHAEYINTHGILLWLLRESVRANPLFVISAALLAYGVMLLNVEIDPQVGKLHGILLSLALLHVYELCMLVVVTIILWKRMDGGRDLHGLVIVAGLFLGGSFLALDELIVFFPATGMLLVPAALLLASVKLGWYGNLRGIRLPADYQYVVLAVLTGHSISSLLGSPNVKLAIGLPAVQSLGWLCGWISLVPVFWLMHIEGRAAATEPPPSDDPMVTRRLGNIAIFLAMLTGMAHLYTSDWIFDRPPAAPLFLPAITMIAAILLIRKWHRGAPLNRRDALLAAFPVIALQWVWADCAYALHWNLEMYLGAACQMCAAGAAFYLALWRATGRNEFLIGLTGPILAPAWATLWRSRAGIPHFRALASAALGFIALLLGMLVSLYRARILGWLDPPRSVGTQAASTITP